MSACDSFSATPVNTPCLDCTPTPTPDPLGECTEGEQQECTIVSGQHGEILNCYTGVTTCVRGEFRECAGPESATWRVAGAVADQSAFSRSSCMGVDCTNLANLCSPCCNPCNPYCVSTGGVIEIEQREPMDASVLPTTPDASADAGSEDIVAGERSAPLTPILTTVTPNCTNQIDDGVQWDKLYYSALPPLGTFVSFRVRTAKTVADLPQATWRAIATATSAQPTCTPADCGTDLYEVLGQDLAHNQTLQIEINAQPGGVALPSQTVEWRVQYSCVPIQ